MTTAATSQRQRTTLFNEHRTLIRAKPELHRRLVSFQANRDTPLYSWFKYKEGFSADFVDYVFDSLTDTPGTVLDPFAGSGTALFVAQSRGWNGIGIEVMPVGKFVAEVRGLATRINPNKLRQELERVSNLDWESLHDEAYAFSHIPITRRAFPKANERAIAGYMAYCKTAVTDPAVRKLLEFACMCILEEISYTRKDGQYLRWDNRSGKPRASSFRKSHISTFGEAIAKKLASMYRDIVTSRQGNGAEGRVTKDSTWTDYRIGSCLKVLPTLDANSVDLIVTSPPYCNRYDYTRTYALELVFLGYTDLQIKSLRQEMLSCTVENRDKVLALQHQYSQAGQESAFRRIDEAFRAQKALHEVLGILERYRVWDRLNNANLVKMIRNYFFETSFVLYELSRILRPRGKVVIVNDNVRYAGEEIPVDLICTELARAFGLVPKHIWTLERGKGNSSQQMGNHGRAELRKCVYVWEKPG